LETLRRRIGLENGFFFAKAGVVAGAFFEKNVSLWGQA
jgi:hypothetical protein